MNETINPYSTLNYIIELTEYCNNRCHHCYNIWKLDKPYKPKKELSAEEWKFLLDKLHRETECNSIAISGGEPTLRPDFLEILDHMYNSLSIRPVLITNGTKLTREFIIECMKRGVRIFELPLLGHTRELHNELSGNDCWDNVISAIVDIKSMGGRPYIVFVITKKNLPYFEDIIKLAIAIETDGMLLNRFNPGGEGVNYIDEFLPSAEEFEKALAIANRLSYEYRYPISCSIPIHPCIINMSQFPYLSTGFCGAGTDRAYYTISPDGTLRPCNHTSTILGDFMTEKFEDLISKPVMEEFKKAIPPICEPCPMAAQCQGGCKATAEVCYGSLTEMDPFLKKNLHRHPAYSGDYSGEMEK